MSNLKRVITYHTTATHVVPPDRSAKQVADVSQLVHGRGICTDNQIAHSRDRSCTGHPAGIAAMNQDRSVPNRSSQDLRSLASPIYYRMPDVLRITGLSRPTIYRRIAEHRFPQSVNLGGRACGWVSTEVHQWIEDPQGYRAPHQASPAS